MKALIVSILLGLPCLAITAHARPNISCNAVDKGWEEHFGGHRNCDDCLKKHGKCVETCSLEYYTCEATGIDSLGGSITVKGSGDDRWEAESNARRHCDRNFRNCSVSNCNSKAETISKRTCERPPDPKPQPTMTPKPQPTATPKPDPKPRPKPKPDDPRPRPPGRDRGGR